MTKYIIFDVDGTLIDSSHGLYDSFMHASEAVGLKPPSIDKFKESIGPPIDKIFNSFFKNEFKLKENFIKFFRSHYDNKGYLGYKMKFDIEKLEKIKNKNISLGIVTNKPSLPTQNILEDMCLVNVFNMVTCKDTYNNSFNKKENLSKIILKIKEDIAINESEFIYVGDTPEDFEAASYCNIPFAAISDGFYKWKSCSNNKIYPSLNRFLETYI